MTIPNVSANRVRIFDTTLRDGEQAPGCSMSRAQKLAVARQLARLGVDIIEAGFPAASPGDWDAVHAIAGEVGTADGPVICGMARAIPNDIQQCAAAIRPAVRHRIHTFLATSDLHLKYKLQISRDEALRRVSGMVALARSLVEDIEFSPEDASRSDPGFLLEVLDVAVDAGATTLNLPDTVGYAMPDEYREMIAAAVARYGARGITISTHCHDDLGMAVANSLIGVRAGARQVECTINGLGERAGNAALEEVVMALMTRTDQYGVALGLTVRELVRTSRVVSEATGVEVPPNKSVVGANAFAHESGIHQDGVLKHRSTYEIMTAESVGFDSNSLVLGKHSGRRALQHHLERLGYRLDSPTLEKVFVRFKEVADRHRRVDDRLLASIVTAE